MLKWGFKDISLIGGCAIYDLLATAKKFRASDTVVRRRWRRVGRVFSAFCMAVVSSYFGNILFETWSDGQSYDSSLQISEMNRDVSNLMIEFRWLVQSWKDILLRGHDSADMREYGADLKRFHASIQEKARKIRGSLSDDDQGFLDEFSRLEVNLFLAYEKALALAAQSASFDYRAADRAVRGMDRAVHQPLAALQEVINRRIFSHLDDTARQAMNVRLICFAFFVITVGTLWLLVRRQIKDQIKREEAKEAHNQQLQSLGKVLASTIHEIKNHVAVIDGRTRQLQKILTTSQDAVERALKFTDDIERVNLRTINLVTAITKFSKKSEIDERSPVSVSDILAETQTIIQRKLEAGSIELAIIKPELDPFILCSAVEISQVLINLLGNAADAIQKLEKPWIRVDISVDQGFVKFSITDSGPGISRDDLKNLSQAFYTTKERGEGTGQGLSYCRAIIARHNGRFAYDDESANTRFLFWVPLAPEKSSQAAA